MSAINNDTYQKNFQTSGNENIWEQMEFDNYSSHSKVLADPSRSDNERANAVSQMQLSLIAAEPEKASEQQCTLLKSAISHLKIFLYLISDEAEREKIYETLSRKLLQLQDRERILDITRKIIWPKIYDLIHLNDNFLSRAAAGGVIGGAIGAIIGIAFPAVGLGTGLLYGFGGGAALTYTCDRLQDLIYHNGKLWEKYSANNHTQAAILSLTIGLCLGYGVSFATGQMLQLDVVSNISDFVVSLGGTWTHEAATKITVIIEFLANNKELITAVGGIGGLTLQYKDQIAKLYQDISKDQQSFNEIISNSRSWVSRNCVLI